MSTITKQLPYTSPEQIYKKNNDPLAHVDLYLSGYSDNIDHRVNVEFYTDTGERIVEQPFKGTFSYDNNFVSDTGLDLRRTLINANEAAAIDVQSGYFSSYHLERSYAYTVQLDQLESWIVDITDTSHRLYVSLCPPSDELNEYEAKRQSFKPDRMMASLQLYEKTKVGINMHAFSLDGLTTERLQELFDVLGIPSKVTHSTLQQLTEPVAFTDELDGQSTVDSIIYYYDNILAKKSGLKHTQGVDEHKYISEANMFVQSHPEAFDMYKQTIKEVATSLEFGSVTAKLNAIVAELRESIVVQSAVVPWALQVSEGQYLSRDAASDIVDYLRRRAIPQYLMNKLKEPQNIAITYSDTSSGYQGISDAGGQAIVMGNSYDGGCPTSNNSTNAAELAALGNAFSVLQNKSLNRESWVWKKVNVLWAIVLQNQIKQRLARARYA